MNTIFNAASATEVALVLAQWDPQGAAPVLRAHIAHCRDKKATWDRHVSSRDILARGIADMTAVLAKSDEQALREYGAWLRTQDPKELGSDVVELMAPLWKHPRHPHVAEAAAWLFDDAGSPWRCLARIKGFGSSDHARGHHCVG